ncbi:MAG: tetratricopeptide repeat protein [Candidatus Thorarchaeota archaeon]|nr:tetratricopeptide repeat protein [Candidatus Thorarchaeota archaeon]
MKSEEQLTPSEDTPAAWFQMGSRLASEGRLVEAERAIKIAVDMQEQFPIAWAILCAILLSQGKETDAEKAGKKAISQCSELKMTWPIFRSIILKHAIRKGANWKIPKRISIDEEGLSKWGETLAIFSKAVTDEIETVKAPAIKPDIEKEKPEEKTIDTPTPPSVKLEREKLPSYSSRTVEGLTKLMDRKLKTTKSTQVTSPDERDEKTKQSELPTYSSRKVVDVTEKYYEELESPEESSSSSPEWTPVTPGQSQTSEAWYSAAEVHLRQGRFDQSEQSLLRGLSMDPKNGKAWLRLGSLLMRRKNYQDAQEAFEKATQFLNRNVEALSALGDCLQEQHKWREAFQVLSKAAIIEQNRPDIYLKIGISEYNLGLYQDASRSFLRVLRIAPSQKDAMFYLAQCMEKQGNRKHALSLYIKLMNLGNLSSEMYEKMSGAFERLGRQYEARESRRQAVLARQAGK